MGAAFQFEQNVAFSADCATETLSSVPTSPGIFALYGPREADEPYLMRAADLRRRITRILAPPDSQSKRLNLRDKVARIAWSVTGSEFESTLLLYEATAARFGVAVARRRLKLHTPFFLRLTLENEHPRVYTTNRLSRRNLAQTYGPFPSRLAAERYADTVLDLFKLRRCYEDLAPYPEHPGCVYQEMKKCLAPCNQACTPDEYAAEATAIEAFLRTSGESMIAAISAERERASAEMEFERAAALHTQWQKVKAAAALASEIVRPVTSLRAIVVQPAAGGAAASEAAIFLLQAGCLAGPERLSTLGVRAVKEQTSVGSSLFAQPLMLQAVPLDSHAPTENPEQRAAGVLARLTEKLDSSADPTTLSDHLSLLRRWFYRPEKQRTGEIFFPNPDGSWPLRRILRGAARMVLGEPAAMADTQRDAVPAAKVRILHEGRADVERAVPVVRSRSRKPAAPAPTGTLSAGGAPAGELRQP